jgi:hypothetical protein
MAFVINDRVKETTSTTGTGTVTLSGAQTGFQSFSSGIGAGNSTYYTIALGAQFEVGIGALTNATTFTRDTVITSSNSNSLVDFLAGTKDIFCTLPASELYKENFDTTVQTSNFNVVKNTGYFVNTTSAAITATLPSSPAFGDQVTFVDYSGTFNLTDKGLGINLNGNKLNGTTTPSGIAVQFQSCTLTFTDATQGWKVTSAGVPSFFSSISISFITAAGSLGTVTDAQRSSYSLSSAAATVNFGSLTYSIQSGSLPGGTSLNSTTAAITGTITQVAVETVFTFTVRATSSLSASVFSDRTFTITVQPPVAFVAATGGTETTSGDFKIHTFTGPGTFTVTNAGNSGGSNSVDYLVVAGGGGGGSNHGGAGGAGGFRGSFPNPATGGLPVSAQGYPITVGAGGAQGTPSISPTQGGSSIFSTITSTGGGIGGSPLGRPGGTGGSGGGGGAYPQPGGTGGAGNTPPVSPSQGNSGGNGTTRTTAGGGGGGGGASGAGTTQPNSPGFSGGPGGAGTATSISASPVTYAGGGGGGSWNEQGGTGGTGGPGGGGNGGGPGAATSGTTNTGGGGGGGRSAGGSGGLGGSGIVVIRYKFQ